MPIDGLAADCDAKPRRSIARIPLDAFSSRMRA
jgi:hypothetical protein